MFFFVFLSFKSNILLTFALEITTSLHKRGSDFLDKQRGKNL